MLILLSRFKIIKRQHKPKADRKLFHPFLLESTKKQIFSIGSYFESKALQATNYFTLEDDEQQQSYPRKKFSYSEKEVQTICKKKSHMPTEGESTYVEDSVVFRK